MPELPEVRHMATIVNAASSDRVFTLIVKSHINRNDAPPLPPAAAKLLKDCAPAHLGNDHSAFAFQSGQTFTIAAASRGKELRLTLRSPRETLRVFVQPGMSGSFVATTGSSESTLNHSHLRFLSGPSSAPVVSKTRGASVSSSSVVVHFVDPRRFGSWRWSQSEQWSEGRGPDPVDEPDALRAHIADALARGTINDRRTIAEVLLDQRYFNGTGNIYRAEALHRCGCDPFLGAATALSSTNAATPPRIAAGRCKSRDSGANAKRCDVIAAVQQVLRESIDNRFAVSYFENGETKGGDGGFEKWLRVYGKRDKPDVRSVPDRQGRTLWYSVSQRAAPPPPAKSQRVTKKPPVASKGSSRKPVKKPAAKRTKKVGATPAKRRATPRSK